MGNNWVAYRHRAASRGLLRALLQLREGLSPAILHIAPCVSVPVSGTGLGAGVHSVTPALLFYLHFCTNYDPHKNINSESEVDTASDAGVE